MASFRQSGSQRGFIEAIDNFGKGGPVMIGAAVAMLVTAGLGVASSFGLVLEGEQIDSIFYFLTALIGVISLYQRARVKTQETVSRLESEHADQIRSLKLELATDAKRAQKSYRIKPRIEAPAPGAAGEQGE